MKWLLPSLTLVLTVGLVSVLNTKLGTVPALGQFLNPYGGFWANAEPRTVAREKALNLEGLRGKVTVVFDDNLVPHIFAQNNHDLYYAQGYVTAMHRLWQMELQTHFAAGRVSEIIGEATAEIDRYNRRMGVTFGAQQAAEAMLGDSVSREVVQAYSDGVNAYVHSLSPADYPLEYKLLGYAPEPWSPLKCALLLKQMAMTLSARSDDRRLTNILNKYGYATTQNLFPNYYFRDDPIIPPGTPLDFKPVPVPQRPKDFLPKPTDKVALYESDPGTGSNNWAISGSKSATGYPILANDPHLDLTLPSIWYQVQLVGPGVNVYGASLPGSPHVISGFNERIAWGVTNVGSDVLDWYEIKFKDARRDQYWHDGKWKPVRKVVEVIKVKGKPDLVDTVRYTHHGPVVYDEGAKQWNAAVPPGHAMRWVAHDPSNEVMTFHKLNRARNYAQYTEALTHYASPAQNFVFASADNDIAIWPNGKFPLKWKEQGKYILDGSNPAHEWQGWVPQAHNPHVKNPPRGFVSSANQFPADTTYPYYLDWGFETYERGARINERLTAMQRATVDSLRMLQNDNMNLLARDVLPRLLSYVSPNQLSDVQLKALGLTRSWNFRNDPDQVGATVFSLWWNDLMTALWEDDFPTNAEYPVRYPTRDRTLKLILDEPDAKWVDNVNTPDKETLALLCTQTFRSAVDTLAKHHGENINQAWQWANHKATHIPHLTRQIKPFGRYNLPIGGGRNIVNATSERNGPSWRMVVALGPQVKGFGVYPGGQSGNPGSYYYDNMVDTWAQGNLNELLFLRKPNEAGNRMLATWALEK